MIFIQICQIIAVCLLSAVLFAILIYISMYSQKRTMPLKIAFIIMFVGGMCIYSYCHYRVIEHYRGLDEESVSGASYDRSLEWARKGNFPMLRTSYVVMRSVIDVGMMFYGRANSDIFYKLPESENPYFVFGFWLLHLITFYTMATALLIRFGNGLLRWIRINISKIFNADVDIVFGINQDSLAFGRKIADKKGNMLVYVDTVVNEEYEALIRDIGGLTYSNKDAIDASTSFLKDICIKPAKTRFRLYVLSGEYDRNLRYAQMMLESLKKADIRPEQTELVLLGTDEWKGMFFQSNETQYGYGSVVSFDEFEMTARLLIHKYPLCNAIKFDENGRATEDMDVLIIGFGHIGHEVLRKVIAAGQFVGSNFRATVYDPKFEQRTGFFKSQYPKMFKNYNVVFKPYDGRGNQIFQFLQDNASTLKYIMICLEDRDVSREIAVRMLDRLHTMGYPLNVYTCDSKSIRCYSQQAQDCETYWIYDSELLYAGELDRNAIEINHRYYKGNSPVEDWKKCGYFDRMSSRASVDYMMPLIRRVTTKNELTNEQRDNLAQSEHLRLCAFYYSFGFDVMEREEVMRRTRNRQYEIIQHGRSDISVTKDRKTMKHACLVGWDELDDISRIENLPMLEDKNYKDSNGLKDEKESFRRWVDMVMKLIQDKGQQG